MACKARIVPTYKHNDRPYPSNVRLLTKRNIENLERKNIKKKRENIQKLKEQWLGRN
jgi:hypothetical protein